MMLTALSEAAVRGGTLLAVLWLALYALRVRDPAVEKNTWTVVVAASFAMPLLSDLAGLVTSPLRVIPLRLLPSSSVTSTAALTGMASDVAQSRLELGCELAYGVVAAVLLARVLTGLRLGARLRRRASVIPALRAGHIDVRVSDTIRSPACFASTILLPVEYLTWDAATVDTVLAHESAHIRNLDCYRLWLAALYRAVFWFDPLSHWLHWRLRTLSEETSDQAALVAAGDREAYAAMLKQMASVRQLIPSTVAMADSPSLGRRINRVLSGQSLGSPLARPWTALLMSAVLALVGVVAVPWAEAEAPGAQRPVTLEFHLVDESNNPVQAQRSGTVPRDDKLYEAQDGTPILVKQEAVVTSDEITRVTVNTTSQGTIVDVRLNARGGASMLSATRGNIDHQMAAVYDGRVINHAVIRGAFGRQFQITGLSEAEAHALAMKFATATE